MAERQELFDFIVEELSRQEALLAHRLRPLRIALKNQWDNLLAFAQVLDEKLVEIAQRFDTPLYLVRAVCLLQRKKPSSCAYWQRWNHLHHLLSLFHHSRQKKKPKALLYIDFTLLSFSDSQIENSHCVRVSEFTSPRVMEEG